MPIFIYLGYVVKTNKVNKSADLYISLFCFICMTIEGMVLHHLNYQRHDSMYIFLVPVMFFLFRYLMSKNSTSNKKTPRNSNRNLYFSLTIYSGN